MVADPNHSYASIIGTFDFLFSIFGCGTVYLHFILNPVTPWRQNVEKNNQICANSFYFMRNFIIFFPVKQK
jgi:hypothetical protein